MLKRPSVILLALVLGVLFGRSLPAYAQRLDVVGDLFMGLLSMCVAPILLTSVTVSLARLLRANDSQRELLRLALVYWVLMGLVSSFATLAAVAGQPGKLSHAAMASINSIIATDRVIDQPVYMDGDLTETPPESGAADSLVPRNVVSAIASDANLQILVFSICFGLALGSLRSESASHLMTTLHGVYESFVRLVHWFMYLLPPALFSMAAVQSAMLGDALFLAMAPFLAVALSILAAVSLCSLLGMSLLLRLPFRELGRVLKDTIIVALTTRNSLACIPFVEEALHKRLGLDERTVSTVVPLGINVGRFGVIAYYAVAAVFVAGLYQMPLDGGAVALIMGASVLAGLASVGTTGVITLSLLAVVLQPLHLPLEAVLVLMVAIDVLVDPFRTLAIVLPNCLATSYLAVRRGQPQTAASGV